MARLMKTALGLFAAIALAGAGAVAGGSVAFERRVSREVADLFAGAAGATPTVVAEADLTGLPEPVQRWLRRARVVGRARPVAVRLKVEGQFRTGEGRAWMPFTAEEYYTTDPPGLVWIATMRMAPLVSIAGRDKYVDGRGALDFRLLGLVPVASASGPELDQGALLRYLNETMWFPAAALSPYIAWEPIDAHAARPTMTYRGVSPPATFYF